MAVPSTGDRDERVERDGASPRTGAEAGDLARDPAVADEPDGLPGELVPFSPRFHCPAFVAAIARREVPGEHEVERDRELGDARRSRRSAR